MALSLADQLCSRDPRGIYFRNLGWKRVEADGDIKHVPHKFYLGRDAAAACENVLQLQRCWDAVSGHWRTDGGPTRPERALWNYPGFGEAFLDVAKAVAAGEKQVVVRPPDGALFLDVLEWGLKVRRAFTDAGVRIEIRLPTENELAATVPDYQQEAAAADRLAGARRKAVPAGGPTLADALDAYTAYLQGRRRDPETGKPTATGATVAREIRVIARQLADRGKTALAAVGADFLHQWLEDWARRPRTQTGSPYALKTCSNVINIIRAFIRWLNKQESFGWTTPTKYDGKVTINTGRDEKAARPRRRWFKREELALLWKHAAPTTRVYILLGLNCAFGVAELVTLRLDEINLDRGIIDRMRQKTGVRGRWYLWNETLAALKWYLKVARPQSDSPYVFLARSGRPLCEVNKTGHKNNNIGRAWSRLFESARREQPDLEWRSFNKLRKTGPNWVRKHFGDEPAELFLSHKTRAAMLDHYADTAFRRLRRPLLVFRKFLSPVLTEVSWPDRLAVTGAGTSQSVIGRIQDLRQQGFKLAKIAELVGVSTATVYRYARGIK
jgi:integrase